MDSVCAINVGMNPAARCQYCGNSGAGTPPAQKGLKNISVGQSSKYALSDKELAVAPSDPGRRYIWATTECIKKVGNCTADDVSNIYDKLIEQSCKAAGADMQIDRAVADIGQKPSEYKCKQTLEICMNKKCGTNFETCKTDSDIDRAASECATDATGCDEYVQGIKQDFKNARAKADANNEAAIQALVKSYQDGRETKLNKIVADCKNDATKRACIETYQGTIGNHAATLICEYYKSACYGFETNNIETIQRTIKGNKINEK